MGKRCNYHVVEAIIVDLCILLHCLLVNKKREACFALSPSPVFPAQLLYSCRACAQRFDKHQHERRRQGAALVCVLCWGIDLRGSHITQVRRRRRTWNREEAATRNEVSLSATVISRWRAQTGAHVYAYAKVIATRRVVPELALSSDSEPMPR